MSEYTVDHETRSTFEAAWENRREDMIRARILVEGVLGQSAAERSELLALEVIDAVEESHDVDGAQHLANSVVQVAHTVAPVSTWELWQVAAEWPWFVDEVAGVEYGLPTDAVGAAVCEFCAQVAQQVVNDMALDY